MTNLDLTLNIYFSLTKKQRRKLDNLGYNRFFLEHVPLTVFEAITKNKKLRADLIILKRKFIRLIAA
jgi:hypothetical protein